MFHIEEKRHADGIDFEAHMSVAEGGVIVRAHAPMNRIRAGVEHGFIWSAHLRDATAKEAEALVDCINRAIHFARSNH